MLLFLLYPFSWSCWHFSLVCGRKQRVCQPSFDLTHQEQFHCNAKHTSVWSSFKGGPVSDAGCFAYIAVMHSDLCIPQTHRHIYQHRITHAECFHGLYQNMKRWNTNIMRMTPQLCAKNFCTSCTCLIQIPTILTRIFACTLCLRPPLYHIYQGCPTHFYWGPHEPYSGPQRIGCNQLSCFVFDFI